MRPHLDDHWSLADIEQSKHVVAVLKDTHDFNPGICFRQPFEQLRQTCVARPRQRVVEEMKSLGPTSRSADLYF